LRVPSLSLRVPALALGVLALALGVRASVSAQQAVFRTSTQYVRVDVVVTDKDDKPIEGLTKDDFEILEEGKPQTVADFTAVSIPAVSREIAVNVAREPQPDVVTNTPPAPDSRLFAIVVDDLHLIEQDLVRIKRTLTDLVNMMSPEDEVALVFVSHSNLSVNFTRDTSKIMARIENIKAALGFGLDALAAGPDVEQPPGGLPAAARGRAESMVDKVAGPPPSRFRAAYAMHAATALQLVAKALAGSSHGRRAVFFVTGGTTIDPFRADAGDALDLDFRGVQDEYKRVFDTAKRADVPIYVIDPRGNLSAAEAVRGAPPASEAILGRIRGNIAIQHNNMAAIAVNTGGRAIFNASDMTRMMQDIVRENGSYYLLGYYPQPFVADGKFHDIQVRVKRDGVRVRARAGYDATKPGASVAAVSTVVNDALEAGVNVSGLPLRVFAEPITTDGKKASIAVTVEVDYPLPMDGTRRIEDELQLKVVALDSDAGIKASATRAHRVAGKVPASGSVRFLINEQLAVPVSPLTLKVAVASKALGKAGAIQMPVAFPKEGGGLTMGGVAIGLDGPPREAALHADAFQGLLPFQPTPTRTFTARDVLRVFGHVYWRKRSVQPVLTVHLRPLGAESEVALASPTLVPAPASGDQQDAVIAALLPLNGLAPGRYHLTVEAALPGGSPVSRDVLFEVR
jgi:VWFA-related protein